MPGEGRLKVGAPSQARPAAGAALLVFLAAALLFARTLSFDLVWDDPLLLERVRSAVAQGGLPGLLRAEFRLGESEAMGYYRPVVLVSLWLDAHLPGPPAFGHHLTNVLLHALNAVLVYLLLGRVFTTRTAALVGGLVFAAHPVHVESVAFVSGRTDLWATLFALLAALCWHHDRPPSSRRLPLRLCGAFALCLAALAKEVALLLPLVLLAWHAAELPRRQEDSPSRPPLAVWLVLWGLAAGAVVLVRRFAGVPWGIGETGRLLDPSALTVGAALLDLERLTTYYRLLVLPWPLNAFYTGDQVAFTPLSLAATALFLGGCLALAVGGRGRPGLKAFAWTLGFLLPVLGLVPISGAVIAERFLYLPSIGLSVLAAAAAERLPRGRTPQCAGTGAFLLLIALLGMATFSRSGVWRDRLSLYSDLVRTTPRYPSAYYNLGNAYSDLGRHREAAATYRQALLLNPRDAEAAIWLGVAHQELGELSEAIVAYRRAVEISPRLSRAHLLLGNALALAGDPPGALAAYDAALRADPASADGHLYRGLALLQIDRPREALASLGEAARLRPAHALAHLQLARVAEALGERELARRERETLRRLDPALAAQLPPPPGGE